MQKYIYVQCTDGLHMRSRLNISDLQCMHRPSVQHMCSRSDVYWTHWTYCACATQLICTHTVATALTELPDIQMARVLKSLPEKSEDGMRTLGFFFSGVYHTLSFSLKCRTMLEWIHHLWFYSYKEIPIHQGQFPSGHVCQKLPVENKVEL